MIPKIPIKDLDPDTRAVLRGMVKIWVRHHNFVSKCGGDSEEVAIDTILSLIEKGYFYLACDEENERGLQNLRIEPNFDMLK